MYSAVRYNQRMLRRIETAMKSGDWKTTQQQAQILLDYLHNGGDVPRMEERQRRYVLKGYLRYILDIPECEK